MGEVNDIRDAVADALVFDPDVDASGITVDGAGGEVTLSGTVPGYPQYLAAAAAARRVSGVASVRNDLQVALPPGDYRDDQALTAAANDALTLDEAAPAGVEARAENGNLVLTGTVRNGAERAAAEALVASVTGVRRVTNNLRVQA
jgi:hyperosmotically inducible protein